MNSNFTACGLFSHLARQGKGSGFLRYIVRWASTKLLFAIENKYEGLGIFKPCQLRGLEVDKFA